MRPLGDLLDKLFKQEVAQEGDGLSLDLSSHMMKFFSMPGQFIGMSVCVCGGGGGGEWETGHPWVHDEVSSPALHWYVSVGVYVQGSSGGGGGGGGGGGYHWTHACAIHWCISVCVCVCVCVGGGGGGGGEMDP